MIFVVTGACQNVKFYKPPVNLKREIYICYEFIRIYS